MTLFKTIGDPPDTALELTVELATALEVRRAALSDLLGFEVTCPQTVAHLLQHARPLPDTMNVMGAQMKYAIQRLGAPDYSKSQIEGYLPAVGSPLRVTLDEDITRLMAGGHKINAIKALRTLYGAVPLKEAKEYVELFPDGRQRNPDPYNPYKNPDDNA
jgi:ribosomal protein L7/L12